MKKIVIIIAIIIISGCSTNPSTVDASRNNWATTQFAWSSKIDYDSPFNYIEYGKISNLSDNNYNLFKKYFSKDINTMAEMDIVSSIYKYMRDINNFKSFAAGGKLIAKRTVDDIFLDKTLSGCHDWGIVLSSLLRKSGIPAIYVDTALIGWAKGYLNSESIQFEGHIFIEAFIDGKWILLNSTNPLMIVDYDPLNPLLGFTRNGTNYFVMFKGIDPWDYGVYSNEDMTNSMMNGAKTIVYESKKLEVNGKIINIK